MAQRMRLAVLLVLFITLGFSDGLNNVKSSENRTEMLQVWPCQMSQNINQYLNFKRKHILLTVFDTTQLNNWAHYIEEMGLCSRHTSQSFFRNEDLHRITSICNGQGTRYSANMCISKETFIVYVIQIMGRINGRCAFEFQIENSYVIVACDLVEGKCLPVHYEGQIGTAPAQRGPDCIR